MDCSPPGSCVHGISQSRILEWLPLLSPGDLPDPGTEPTSPASLELEGRFFTIEPPGEPPLWYIVIAQLLSRVQFFVIPWTAARQAPLSFTISQSLLRFMSTELVMLSNHLILCCPLFLLPSFPSFRVFTDKLTLCIR